MNNEEKTKSWIVLPVMNSIPPEHRVRQPSHGKKPCRHAAEGCVMNKANTWGSPPKGAQVTELDYVAFSYRFCNLDFTCFLPSAAPPRHVHVYIPHTSKVNGNVVTRQIFPIKTLPKADVWGPTGFTDLLSKEHIREDGCSPVGL